MTTRTRYKRGSGSAYGYGGAWLRSWFGAAPPAAAPGAGGNSAQEFRGAQAVTAAVPDPYSMLKGALTMGGSVIGRSADGKITYVSIGGMVVPFNTATGTQAGPPTPGSATGATAAATGGGTATGGAAGPSGGTGVATGGGGSRVGQKVTAQTANGVVSGTITAEANGQTTVTWDDGTVANYGGDGKLVSSTPPTGTAGGTGAGGTVIPGDGGDTTPPPVEPTPVVAPGGVATDEGQITSGAVPGYTPPAPGAPTDAPPPAPSDLSDPFGSPNGQMPAPNVYTSAPAAPTPPVVAPGGVATDEGQITSGAYTPAPYVPPPAPPPAPSDLSDPFGSPTGQMAAPNVYSSAPYVPPPPPAPVADPNAGMISTAYGWLTVDQLQAMFGPSSGNPAYVPPPTPTPAPPPAPSPYQPPPGVATDEGQLTSGSYGYVPPPPPLPYGGYGSGMY